MKSPPSRASSGSTSTGYSRTAAAIFQRPRGVWTFTVVRYSESFRSIRHDASLSGSLTTALRLRAALVPHGTRLPARSLHGHADSIFAPNRRGGCTLVV